MTQFAKYSLQNCTVTLFFTQKETPSVAEFFKTC